MIGLRTNPGGPAPCDLSGDAVRRGREWAADEARWAAQLRNGARPGPPEREPAAAATPAPVRTMLDVVNGMTRYDSLLIPRALPVTVGGDAEDLACGECGGIIASRASRDTVRSLFPEGDRVVVRCPCRALNVLCGMAGRSNRQVLRQPARRIRA